MKTKHNVTISQSNSKLGAFVPTVNLPPIITCRCSAPCKNTCYARRGNFRFPNVQKSLSNNLKSYLTDASAYFNDIISFLKNGLVIYKFFRWHSAGDIVDAEYFNGIVNVAMSCPNTTFLMFTKKFELVNEYIQKNGELPSNLRVVFSAWDKSFNVPNPYNLPVAYVNFCDSSKNPDIPVTAFKCSGNCEKCLTCWQLKNGQSTVFNQH